MDQHKTKEQLPPSPFHPIRHRTNPYQRLQHPHQCTRHQSHQFENRQLPCPNRWLFTIRVTRYVPLRYLPSLEDLSHRPLSRRKWSLLWQSSTPRQHLAGSRMRFHRPFRSLDVCRKCQLQRPLFHRYQCRLGSH